MQRVPRPLLDRVPSPLLVLASGAWLAGATQAQKPIGLRPSLGQPCGPEQVSHGNFVCGPVGAFELDFGALVSVDLDGNLTPEVAVRQGNRLVLFVNPDVGDEHVVIGSGVRAVAAASGEPRLFFTDAAGLHELELVDGEVHAKLIQEGAPWSGAPILVGARDGSLVVVDSSGRGLFIAKPGTEPAFDTTPLFSAEAPVRALQRIEWDGHDGLELAWLDARGLQVRSLTGDKLLEIRDFLPGGELTTIARGAGKEGLAWVARLADGGTYLLHFRAELPGAFEGPLLLETSGVDSLAAGDLDGDGDEELLLGERFGGRVAVLTNHAELPGVPTFSGIDQELALSLAEGLTPLASGQILCADLFNDRADDGSVRRGVAAMLCDPPGLRLVPQGEALGDFAEDERPASQHVQRVTFESAFQQAGCSPGVTGPLARWGLTTGVGWNAGAATHVELIVRVSSQPGQAPAPVALHHTMTPVGPQGVEGTQIFFEGLEDPSEAENSARVYFAQLRPVRLDPTGRHILKAWRWSVVGLSASCDGLIWLGTLPGALQETVPIVPLSCAPVLECGFGIPVDTIGGRIYIPSAVPQLRVPGNGPGVLPIVWPWDY